MARSPVRLLYPLILTLLAGGMHVARAAEDGMITLHYNERYPYSYVADGRVAGIVAEPIEAAFRKAGVPFRWADTPGARQFHVIKSNRGLDCLAGRFRNAERESYARFSKPVYRDLSQVLLVRADNERFKQQQTMEETLRAVDNRVLLKLAYSYGPSIDAWLAARERPAIVTADENVEMLKQIHERRADLLIIAEEEAAGLIERSGLPAKDFRLLKFRDAPAGEFRYIMCSRQVPAGVIERLDAAITFKPR